MAGKCSRRDSKYSNADIRHISKQNVSVGLERDTAGNFISSVENKVY